jgi:antitoxin (DNA-binding transcriptional repressor) of toxin-antitoxin stability system
MQASVVDLRYRMRDVLRALDRKEDVKIIYHGKVKGVIVPFRNTKFRSIREHPFFGMCKNDRESVASVMKRLRKPRSHDV